MDESETLYVELVKEEMIGTLESGALREPMQQYQYIDTVLQRLLLLKDPQINSVCKKYFLDQKKIKQDMEKSQKEYQRLLDIYADNCKDIYEEIKKL